MHSIIPFFSIIIPLYNKERFIKKTLQSAINQSYTNFEIIIINDGSKDNSLQAAQTITDNRIKITTIKNSGVSKARNYGVSLALADYIVFLDADDIWEVNHLENLKTLLKNYPNCGLYATAYKKQINNTTLNSIYIAIPKNKSWSGIVPNYFESSRIDAIAWTSAVMMPKSVFNALSGFDESITLGAGEDTDLWLRTALNYDIAFSNTPTAIHIQHADNRLTKTNTNIRTFINLDKYDDLAKSNNSLRQYLDSNRFSIGLKFKLAGNLSKAKDYFSKIDYTNLNLKQKLLIKLNTKFIKLLIKLQNLLRQFKVNVTIQN